jgi:sulfite exporter TauE/SafE/copper chaperone CopZ
MVKLKKENINKTQIFRVSGMHCSSCEVLIEKKLLKHKGIEAVEANAGRGEVVVIHSGDRPRVEDLDQLFAKDGYRFSVSSLVSAPEGQKDYWLILLTAGLVITIFLGLNRLGLGQLVSVDSQSSFLIFLIFGLLAGVSSCAALVGGMVLSMAKQWQELYGNQTTIKKMQPHFLFNLGRLVSFSLLGGLLGLVGQSLGVSLAFTSFLVLGVSLLMVLMGLQMLGIRQLRNFQLASPKFISRYIADEENFKGRLMPFLMGALTFFLPCGFTITVQGLALLASGFWPGALMMGAFVLGTTPALLGIGLTSIKFSQRPHFAARFTKVAGVLVLFFALYNLNSQFNVLGWPSLNDLTAGSQASQVDSEQGLPPIIDGKQVIKMKALAYGYEPNYFKVRVGVPVRWEIIDQGTSGCTNAIIARGLFEGQISLSHGAISVKEFTPPKAGRYKFSCWMGMVSGVIEVADKNNPSSADSNNFVPSGASGCSCCGGGR